MKIYRKNVAHMTLSNETERSYSYDVSMDMLNGDALMKPCGYQTLICEIAERHLRQFHLNVDDLAPYHLSWVMISSSFEIVRPIVGQPTVIGRTWHSEQERLTFRRDFSFIDTDGTPLFHAVTFSVLMDTDTRKIVRPDKLPISIGQPYPSFVMEASHKLHPNGDMQPCDRRRIYPSHIDCLGHTNNCRYSEFAYDALTDDELRRLDTLRRMNIYYKSELRLGDSFTMRRSAPGVTNGELLIDGVNDATGKQSFACRMIFEP